MIKQILLDILDYLRYKVVNDKCTPDELRSITHTIIENLDIDATVSDIAEFYGQSENNVRNVCSRNFMPKPKRRVYYNFAAFNKILPKSWKRK